MTKNLTAIAGAAMTVGCLVDILLILPRLTPYEFVSCTAFIGGTQCFGSLNPVYPGLYLASLGGVVLLFLGLFDRSFVLSPLFVVGMLIAGWGFAGVVFGYLGYQWCSGEPLPTTCIAYNPGFFLPAIVGGMLLIGGNAALRRRWLHHQHTVS